MSKLKEFWVFKGTSNFCSELDYDYENEKDVKCRPDGFYDIVADRDTVESGVHVIEYAAYEDLKFELETTEKVYRMNRTYVEEAKAALEAEKALNSKLLAVLNRIALYSSGAEAYTSDFTNNVSAWVRSVLEECK